MRAARVIALASLLGALGSSVPAHPVDVDRVAVLDLGEPRVRVAVESALRESGFGTHDDALVDAAARGAGYAGSTNLTLDDARRLAQSIGAPTLVIGVASVVEASEAPGRRSGDAFVGLFVVDGASGRLLRYAGLRAMAVDRAGALEAILVDVRTEVAEWPSMLHEAAVRRRDGADGPNWSGAAVDFLAYPDGVDGSTPPRFFTKPSPAFTADADRAHAVATVDLIVQFNADGTYGPIEVVRWAGFGLDEAAVSAVRGSRFWAARSAGRPVTARALLRYNFRFRDR